MRSFTAVDLFCGCGGLSRGVQDAGGRIVAGIDLDSVALSTFRSNFPEAQALSLDLATHDPADLAAALSLRRGELDLLVGGPPCQGFSKNVPRRDRFLEDTRNRLVRAFLSHCDGLLPRFVMMENVAEMRNSFEQAYTSEITEFLEARGYTVHHRVLVASDYGVPQRRRRAFFLAARDGEGVNLPVALHSAESGGLPGLCSLPYVTVWDAIGDLPSLRNGEGKDPGTYASTPFSDFQTLMRRGSRRIHNHVARNLRPTQLQRINALKPGQGIKDLPARLRPRSGYSGAYGRLTKEMVAPTITRWVFHPGSGRWGHPVDSRVITMREAARLQSFPDAFRFEGTYIQQSHQIGNAVPPLLAQRVVEALHVSGKRPPSSYIPSKRSTSFA